MHDTLEEFRRYREKMNEMSVANSEDRACWPMRTSAGHVQNDSLNKSALAKGSTLLVFHD